MCLLVPLLCKEGGGEGEREKERRGERERDKRDGREKQKQLNSRRGY